MVDAQGENARIPEAERRLAAQVGAHASWAQTADRSARTAPARAAMDAKFLERADGDPIRAAHLRKAHFARLALKSAVSRRKAREATADAEAAERLLSCPCGCEPDDGPCITEKPTPTGSPCACSTYGIEHLQTDDALRAHFDGHPDEAA